MEEIANPDNDDLMINNNNNNYQPNSSMPSHNNNSKDDNNPQMNSLISSLSTSFQDYANLQPIGSGAGSIVVKMMCLRNKKEYAIKVVDKRSSYYKTAFNRLKNEIDVHLQLKHKHIVRMRKSFEDHENLYLVMEYCEGGDLFQYLQQKKRLDEQEAMKISYELALGLKYLHDRSIIHRDLKLGNILLANDHTVKICDFGLAAKLTHTESEKNTICGTPNYISPEILNKQPYGMKIDCWSFGCVLYALVKGHPPFQGSDVAQTLQKVNNPQQLTFPQHISQNLKSLLLSILDWNQDSRFTVDQILAHPFYEAARKEAQQQPSQQCQEESLSFFNSVKSLNGATKSNNNILGAQGQKKYADNFYQLLDQNSSSNNNVVSQKSVSPSARISSQIKQGSLPLNQNNEKITQQINEEQQQRQEKELRQQQQQQQKLQMTDKQQQQQQQQQLLQEQCSPKQPRAMHSDGFNRKRSPEETEKHKQNTELQLYNPASALLLKNPKGSMIELSQKAPIVVTHKDFKQRQQIKYEQREEEDYQFAHPLNINKQKSLTAQTFSNNADVSAERTRTKSPSGFPAGKQQQTNQLQLQQQQQQRQEYKQMNSQLQQPSDIVAINNHSNVQADLVKREFMQNISKVKLDSHKIQQQSISVNSDNTINKKQHHLHHHHHHQNQHHSQQNQQQYHQQHSQPISKQGGYPPQQSHLDFSSVNNNNNTPSENQLTSPSYASPWRQQQQQQYLQQQSTKSPTIQSQYIHSSLLEVKGDRQVNDQLNNGRRINNTAFENNTKKSMMSSSQVILPQHSNTYTDNNNQNKNNTAVVPIQQIKTQQDLERFSEDINKRQINRIMTVQDDRRNDDEIDGYVVSPQSTSSFINKSSNNNKNIQLFNNREGQSKHVASSINLNSINNNNINNAENNNSKWIPSAQNMIVPYKQTVSFGGPRSLTIGNNLPQHPSSNVVNISEKQFKSIEQLPNDSKQQQQQELDRSVSSNSTNTNTTNVLAETAHFPSKTQIPYDRKSDQILHSERSSSQILMNNQGGQVGSNSKTSSVLNKNNTSRNAFGNNEGMKGSMIVMPTHGNTNIQQQQNTLSLIDRRANQSSGLISTKAKFLKTEQSLSQLISAESKLPEGDNSTMSKPAASNIPSDHTNTNKGAIRSSMQNDKMFLALQLNSIKQQQSPVSSSNQSSSLVFQPPALSSASHSVQISDSVTAVTTTGGITPRRNIQHKMSSPIDMQPYVTNTSNAGQNLKQFNSMSNNNNTTEMGITSTTSLVSVTSGGGSVIQPISSNRKHKSFQPSRISAENISIQGINQGYQENNGKTETDIEEKLLEYPQDNNNNNNRRLFPAQLEGKSINVISRSTSNGGVSQSVQQLPSNGNFRSKNIFEQLQQPNQLKVQQNNYLPIKSPGFSQIVAQNKPLKRYETDGDWRDNDDQKMIQGYSNQYSNQPVNSNNSNIGSSTLNLNQTDDNQYDGQDDSNDNGYSQQVGQVSFGNFPQNAPYQQQQQQQQKQTYLHLQQQMLKDKLFSNSRNISSNQSEQPSQMLSPKLAITNGQDNYGIAVKATAMNNTTSNSKTNTKLINGLSSADSTNESANALFNNNNNNTNYSGQKQRIPSQSSSQHHSNIAALLNNNNNNISNTNASNNNIASHQEAPPNGEPFETPRVDQLPSFLSPQRKHNNLMNTDSNIFPRNHNNTTTAKNMSSLDAFISPNKGITSHRRPSALLVCRMAASKFSTQHGTIEITANKEFLLVSKKKNLILQVSPNGQQIALTKYEDPTSRKMYSLDTLPEKYWQHYAYCKTVCQAMAISLQEKQEKGGSNNNTNNPTNSGSSSILNPRVRVENEEGLFELFENRFEGNFRSGTIVNYKLSAGTLQVKSNKYAPAFDLNLKDVQHASKELKIVVDKTFKILQNMQAMKQL